MHMKDNLINFLYDKEYFINIYEGFIHVFNYEELTSITNKLIVLKLTNFNLEIKGTDLLISKLLPNEILIKGNITNVGKKYV
ncbi:MAG: YabP/YqfC family sporulation protein [Bacilli bacterium]